MKTDPPSPDRRLKKRHQRDNGFFPWLIIIGAGVLFVFIGVGAPIFTGENNPGDYWMGLFTELVSVVGAIGVLDVLARWREQHARFRQYEEEAASPIHSVALPAAMALYNAGYLDGNKSRLRYSDLSYANWHEARLHEVNLEGAVFQGAKLMKVLFRKAQLQGVDFSEADLQNADLFSAEMEGVVFIRANLRGANLAYANLSNAKLVDTDLQGANLRGANLKGVEVYEVRCDENTILPDGSNWRDGVLLE